MHAGVGPFLPTATSSGDGSFFVPVVGRCHGVMVAALLQIWSPVPERLSDLRRLRGPPRSCLLLPIELCCTLAEKGTNAQTARLTECGFKFPFFFILVTWLLPTVIAEIAFACVTGDCPSFA
ncbi:hypothetical protein QBC41DRAFT_112376 [Cercophora samala]|uniref:Uncharacterized protein n=1 Tax=Cercophora samala TaxID=330535 RepID=A0AA39ZDN3_9PEZI|nr:hypothetical protein QBC41DRAFT_112376 [Cercophora samala]